MKIIKWDGNSLTSNYSAALMDGSSLSLPGVRARQVGRLGKWPVFGGLERPGRVLTVGIEITASGVAAARATLLGWFDPEDETPKKLSAADDDGSSNERYVYAVCEGLQAQPSREGGALATLYVATLRVHGDVRWRAETEDSDVWSITASGDTNVVANGGTDDAYPRFTIEPTSAKTGGYDYRRWVPVRWRRAVAFYEYPYELTDGGLDTDALVTATKVQADGDDFRVWVDGVEVDRWFGASGTHVFNQTATYVWVNLNMWPNVELTLKTAIASTGAVTEIEVNEDISSMPGEGILLIGTEAFTYTGRTPADKTFTGVTRATRGTSMAAHAAAADVYWIQHDVWILYGNSTATAPTVDDDKEPAFNLDSTNTSWDYDDFGYGQYAYPKKTGRWMPTYGRAYVGNQGTTEYPSSTTSWAEMGIHTGQGKWTLYNPCGITAANFQNGEKYATSVSLFDAEIRSSMDGVNWTTEDSIAAPSSATTWESWSDNETLESESKYVQLIMPDYIGSGYYVEAADVTLTLNSSYTPTNAFMGSEQGSSYSLECTLTNNTTGEAIELSYRMAVNEELEVDTYEKTVTNLEDDSAQMQALTLVGGARRHWLKLQPGNNTLQFDDTGTAAVTVTTEFAERSYG